MSTKRSLVVGVDPGSGVSSPTGFAAFYPDTKEVAHVCTITSKGKEARHRIREIANEFGDLLSSIDPELEVHVFCESFVMRGKGGETLARLTGALMSRIPAGMSFDFVQNTTVKRIVGGHGLADKATVGAWVDAYFGRLIGVGPDEYDALAIGIAGWKREGTDG